jgi:hypothetical protein
MARNMSDAHAQIASGRGSWGQGMTIFWWNQPPTVFFFGIYYDQAPKSADQCKGMWFVERE